MLKQIITVYDSKAETHSAPVFAVAKGEAIRSFIDAVNDPVTPFYKHPEDYTLFHLGTFDESNGTFDLLTAPVSLGTAIGFKTPVAA